MGTRRGLTEMLFFEVKSLGFCFTCLSFGLLILASCSSQNSTLSNSKTSSTSSSTEVSSSTTSETTLSLGVDSVTSYRWGTTPIQASYISRNDAAEIAVFKANDSSSGVDGNASNLDFVTITGNCMLAEYTGGYITWELFDAANQSLKITSAGDVVGFSDPLSRFPAWAKFGSLQGECKNGRYSMRIPVVMGFEGTTTDFSLPRIGNYLIDLRIHGTNTDSAGRTVDYTPEQGGVFRFRIVVSRASNCPPGSCSSTPL